MATMIGNQSVKFDCGHRQSQRGSVVGVASIVTCTLWMFSKSLSTLLTCRTECRESTFFHLAFVRFIPVQVTLTPAVVSWHALPICMLWRKAKAIRSWTLVTAGSGWERVRAAFALGGLH